MANIQFKNVERATATWQSCAASRSTSGTASSHRDRGPVRQVDPAAHGGGPRADHLGRTHHRRVVNNLEPKDRDCAMVFLYALYPHMTVFDNMAYGLKIRGVPKDEIERRVNEAAKMLELGGLLARRPRQLSGGQRQRVAMGRASPPSFSSTNRSRTSTQSCACRRACRMQSCTAVSRRRVFTSLTIRS